MRKFALAFLAATVALAGAASAQEDMPFALDWKFEGPSAPYFAAIDNGHFEAAGLNVEISAGQGSLDAIPKVATGAFPVGFADINSLVKFLDQNPGAPVTAVMMVYDKPPFAVVGRKSLGVMVPKDLEGRVLGAPPPDGAWAQFPAFATANGLDVDKVTGFIAAVAKGWKDAIADPAKAVESLVKRNPAADAALETRRLQLSIDANVLTDYTSANGIGGIDAARMEKALMQIAETYEFQNEPDASLYFTDAYLPAAEMRMLQ